MSKGAMQGWKTGLPANGGINFSPGQVFRNGHKKSLKLSNLKLCKGGRPGSNRRPSEPQSDALTN